MRDTPSLARKQTWKNQSSRFSWTVFPAHLLFFLMLFLPTAYAPAKVVLIILVLTAIGSQLFLRGRFRLHRSVLVWTLLMITTSLAFMYLGWVNNAPGALRVGTVYVLWPVLYAIYIAGAARQSILEGLLRVLVIATVAIGLYFLYFVLHESGWLPDAFYFSIEGLDVSQGQRIAFYEGYTRANLHSFTTLFFTVPFLVSALLFWPKARTYPVARRWLWLALGLGLLTVFLSGRRGLWLVVGLCFPIAVLFWLLGRPRSYDLNRLLRTIIWGTAVLLIVIGLLKWSINLSIQSMSEFSSEGFDQPRELQMYALLQGWLASPLFGAGHGASAADFGFVRVEGKEWMYELFYLALLYQTGLVGVVIYASGVIWIYWMGLRMLRSGDRLGRYIAPILVGTACFLLATMTNPYLGTYDYLWVIFLPVAFINRWLLDRRRNTLQLLIRPRAKSHVRLVDADGGSGRR